MDDPLIIFSFFASFQDEDENVASLPKKVDAFLRYINDLYFEGQVSISKTFLSHKQYRKARPFFRQNIFLLLYSQLSAIIS